MKLEFKGYSDDTFCYYGAPQGHLRRKLEDGRVVDTHWNDHDDCCAGSVRTVLVEASDGRLAVTGVYGQGCCWSVGIAPIDDDDPMPSWPMRWRFEGYTTVLEIDAPDEAVVTLVQPLGEADDE